MHETIIDALRRGAQDEALQGARAAVADAPGDFRAHQLLADALRMGGDNAGALASIERALALAPDDALLHFERAGLLLGEQRVDEAQAALARSTGLDPNQFGAYVLKAQLALGRGDLDEAEAQRKLAARLAPEHPQLAAIEGMIALRHGDAQRAQQVLAAAYQQAPDDVQVRYALGFAYFELGHYAFAEQAFRGVLERTGDATRLRALIADALRMQGRHSEAAEMLAPLLDDPAQATPGLRRIAGELELSAGNAQRAEPLLREAFIAQPRDRRALLALLEAWRRGGDMAIARDTLDRVLADAPDLDDAWRARLALEPVAGPQARTVVERWAEAAPHSVPALDMLMNLQALNGDADAADATAARILAIEPGRTSAEWQQLRGLMARDPAAAVERTERLLERAGNDDSRRLLRGWQALALDRAGRHADAAAAWSALQAEAAPRLIPLPQPTAPEIALADPPADAAPQPDVVFLVGAPGSRVEQVASLLRGTTTVFRDDRFAPAPPNDVFQNALAPARLRDGTLDPGTAFASWRDGLQARGIQGPVIDWLLWWDNAFLQVLRAHLPRARLVVALRDPRDMLLDWLAFAAPAPLAFTAPVEAAQWLRAQLEHVAVLPAGDLQPHALLRLDAVVDAPEALAQAVGDALQVRLPVPPASALGVPHFAPGHWRAYSDALDEAFAVLAPIAVRLGYPEA